MKKKNLKLILITIIFLCGLLLRVVKLDKIPVSLTIDEVAVAYNSFSILKTGKDEFGTFMPLAFRSVGDYKPPLLIYASIPAISIFGLTEVGTRITVALFGALTIFVVFWLVSIMVKDQRVAFIAALSVALSPWHIKFSRSTFEAILALFLVLLGTLIFLWSIKNKNRFLFLSAILYVLSGYAYHSERVFTPLLVLGLVFVFWRELLKFKKQLVIAVVAGSLLVLPLVVVLATPQGRIRATSTFLTRDFELSSSLHKTGEKLNVSQLIFDNNLVLTLNFWFKRYLDYFDLNYLFVKGMGFTIPNSPDLGLLYLFELPVFLWGFFVLTFKKVVEKKMKFLILYWFLIGPLAASLANNPQHPLRSLTLIPVPQLLIGLGFVGILDKLSLLKRKVLVTGYLLLIVIGVAYFVDLYFVQYQLLYSEYSMDGWKEAAKFALENRIKYQEIVVDPRFGTQGPYTVGTPYLYILFYGKIDPRVYQNDPRRKEFETSSNFQNFTFREIDWRGGKDSDQNNKQTLFVGSQWVLPAKDEQILKKFYIVNGKEILRAVSTR